MSDRRQKLDALLERYGVQPVGRGYIDCICPRESAAAFLEELEALGIPVEAYTLWQYMGGPTETVHGMGGPRCRYREGWYSELYAGKRRFTGFRDLDVFLTEEETRLQCTLVPGFWLVIPETWGDCLPK